MAGHFCSQVLTFSFSLIHGEGSLTLSLVSLSYYPQGIGSQRTTGTCLLLSLLLRAGGWLRLLLMSPSDPLPDSWFWRFSDYSCGGDLALWQASSQMKSNPAIVLGGIMEVLDSMSILWVPRGHGEMGASVTLSY